MGMLIEGVWSEDDQIIENGHFVRQKNVYQEDIKPTIIEAIASEPGRFHLIASLSCPWSHRTLIIRQLKGLRALIPIQIAGGTRVEGYPANHGRPWLVPGTKMEITHMHELYSLSDAQYTGRVTVPVLWDSLTRKIISNDSSAIIRALDSVILKHAKVSFTLLPENLREDINALIATFQENLCNAVYQAGLAESQEAYDSAVTRVFNTLDMLENRLTNQRYLFGAFITEADCKLFPTLVRFDSVYHTHFRCTRRRLIDYKYLWAYARDLYCWKGMAELVDFKVIREGYYLNDGANNPFGILAIAPDCDWHAPHHRDRLGASQVVLRTDEAYTIDPENFNRDIGN